ncbi:MAG: OTU domain-containing protein [bacterium]
MKIKLISSLMVMLFACLASISGGILNKDQCRILNRFERDGIDVTDSKKKNCYADVRLSIAQGAASNAEDAILKKFREIIGNGTFDRLAGLSLESLIQGLGANLEIENLIENRIRLWFIRERINDSIDDATLKSISNFKNFYVTWKDLLDSIRDAKQWADTQPGGSIGVKLHDSFLPLSTAYAVALANMLEGSNAEWNMVSEGAPEIHVQPSESSVAILPSSTPNMPPPSYEEATRVSARKNATDPSTSGVQPTNYFPQQPGGISVWTALQAGAVANSARVRQDPISEMVTKFPLEDVLKGDKSTLEDFKSYLKTLPERYLSKGDEYMELPKGLTDFLNSIGYRAVATPGVGNCAFDAVLLSLLGQMDIYQPQYNDILGKYLEQQIPDFRKGIAKLVEDSKKDLKTKIQKNKEWCDQEMFPFMAKKLQKKITLISYSFGGTEVISYLPTGDRDVDIPAYHHAGMMDRTLTSEEFFISAVAEDSLFIAFNGVNHYVALLDKNNSKQ